MAHDGVQETRPPEAVVSVIITGNPDDLRASVCSLGGFFASPDSASGWLSQHPDGTLLNVPTPSATREASYGCSSQPDRRRTNVPGQRGHPGACPAGLRNETA